MRQPESLTTYELEKLLAAYTAEQLDLLRRLTSNRLQAIRERFLRHGLPTSMRDLTHSMDPRLRFMSTVTYSAYLREQPQLQSVHTSTGATVLLPAGLTHEQVIVAISGYEDYRLEQRYEKG